MPPSSDIAEEIRREASRTEEASLYIGYQNMQYYSEFSDELFNQPNLARNVYGNTYFNPRDHVFSSNTSSLGNKYEFNEAKVERESKMEEIMRLKRKMANRESAQRMRLRRKKQIEELQSQVDHLRSVNNQLMQRLVHQFESNSQILQENAKLKAKFSSLHKVVDDLKTPLRSLQEIAEKSAQFYLDKTN